MEEEIKQNNFLEYGEHNGNLYGTHVESIKDVIKSGKMCVLDVAPNSLKILHNSQELMPFVIFVAAPGMDQLKQIYAERRATGSNRNLSVGFVYYIFRYHYITCTITLIQIAQNCCVKK